jgi:hypothetical protein
LIYVPDFDIQRYGLVFIEQHIDFGFMRIGPHQAVMLGKRGIKSGLVNFIGVISLFVPLKIHFAMIEVAVGNVENPITVAVEGIADRDLAPPD